MKNKSSVFATKILSVFALITMAIVGVFSGCVLGKDSYRLELNKENNVLEYQSEFDFEEYFSNSYIKVISPSGEEGYVQLEQEMFESAVDTSSVGEKSIKISYKKQEFVFNYSVKYKVQFIADNNLFDTQLVLDKSELDSSKIPTKENYTFGGWEEIPETLSDNIVVNAIFTENVVLPSLASLKAEYLDKLGSVALPSNKFGAWQFVQDENTVLNSVGVQNFNVQFVLNNGEVYATDQVAISVGKKTLQFINVVVQFEYDGKEKAPSYNLDLADIKDVNVEFICISDSVAKNVGLYEYALIINDENYQGEHIGTLEITKKDVTAIIESKQMFYNTSVPAFSVNILDANGKELNSELVSELNVKVDAPLLSPVCGEYEIDLQEKNYDNFNVSVVKGRLTVLKATHDVYAIVNEDQVVYGNLLKDVQISSSNPTAGSWQWVEDMPILTMGEISVKVRFVPVDRDNYNVIDREITLTVLKRRVEIKIEQKEFVYSGSEQELIFSVVGILDCDSEKDYVVLGNTAKINAGDYDITLSLQSDKYQASLTEKLVINKANVADFALIQSEIGPLTYNKDNASIIGHVKLPSNEYMWGDPNKQLLIGENVCQVLFVPVDQENYNNQQGEITITLLKAESVITAKNTIFEYNENADYNLGITLSHAESQLTYKYFLNGTEVDGLNNAGLYLVEITCEESEHYLKGELSIEVEIIAIELKPANVWTGDVAEISDTKTITYLDTLNIGAKFGTVEILATGINGTEYNENSMPTEAGTYSITLTVEEDPTYTRLEKTFTLIINPRQIILTAQVYKDVEVYENTFDYTNESNMISLPSLNVDTEGRFEYSFAYGQKIIDGTVNVMVAFYPNDARNFVSSQKAVAKLKVKQVAYIGNNYYGSIESALKASVSGDVIWVVAGEKDAIIVSDCTIKSGVTLNIPHTADSMNKNGTATKNIGKLPVIDVLTLITIDSNVKLTINGKLQIAGELDGGGGGYPFAGSTNGNTAKLVLKDNAIIDSINGTINLFGLIVEETDNNGSQVIVNGGSLYLPFVVRNYGGGTYYSSMYNSGVATAFNEFELRNITVFTTIKNSANVYGYANLYAGNQHNATTINLVSTTENAVVHFASENSYMTFKYDIVGGYTGADDWQDGIMSINLYGGATADPMSIKIIVTLLILPQEFNITTKGVFFPLSWRFNIALYDGTYKMDYMYKLLPGCVFTIGQDATLEIGTLTVYTEAAMDAVPTVSHPAVYSNLDAGDAQCIVKDGGTLIVKSAVGGLITIEEGGTFTNNGATSVTSYEGKYKGKTWYGTTEYTTQSITLTLSTKQVAKPE
ncbi:MAG: hypothetical protein J6Q32_01685 [Clostridia bacterium]|nr:hypothetical protein [Clostridia bacterium]